MAKNRKHESTNPTLHLHKFACGIWKCDTLAPSSGSTKKYWVKAKQLQTKH